MIKKICFTVLFALIMVLPTGCTTYNGISQADKPGTYYIVTNTKKFIGTRTGVLLCTSDPETGDLKCKYVEDSWE